MKDATEMKGVIGPLATTPVSGRDQGARQVSPLETQAKSSEREGDADISFLSRLRACDSLDRFSGVAIILLTLVTLFLLITTQASEPPDKAELVRKVDGAAVAVQPESLMRLKVAKDLLHNNNLDQAEEIIQGLARDIPYEGTVHMLQGDIHWRRQDPLKAIHAYRQAIDLNPDFLDKKTELFQGKKIKQVLEEAERALKGLESGEGEAAAMQEHRKVFLYLKRRLAGSCG